MKCLICIPFAYKREYNSGVNLSGGDSVYLKNALVALLSAKENNPNCDVAFATNLSEFDLPDLFKKMLRQYEIIVLNIAYDLFVFPQNYLWSLAFYKLCVMSYLAETDYDAICYMDTDVFVQGCLDPIWEECKNNIMLYDINHGLRTRDYQILIEEIEQFTGERKYITHYGGEFFAASTPNAKEFARECLRVYNEMAERKTITTKGDEFVLSLVADRMRTKIKNAGAYVYRFWTGTDFRLVSTCYKYNPVLILHVPDEKEVGMLKLYRRISKTFSIPPKEKVWKELRLTKQPLYYLLKKRVRILLKRT